MTNLQKWQHFAEPFPTHNRYIDFSWYWTVGAALQRRVWLDSKLNQTFPNQYMLFVAEPGVGKTMLTKATQRIFESMLEDNATPAKKLDDMRKLNGKLLFPISASSTSFEAFVEFTSKSMRQVRFGEGGKQQYLHCSPAFILDEAASIFDKDAGKMATFLLEGWSCSDRYTRSTIGRGEDMVINLCINLIGGIQPGKLKELSNISIIDNGFSRRCLMVYADKPNKHCAFIEHTQSQEDAYFELFPYVRSLSKLYGPVTMTPEARAWMIENFATHIAPPLNKSHYLAHYYTTKVQHVKKLAMCIHFSETLAMEMSVDPFIKAKALLDDIECDMHRAYVGSRDTRGEVIGRIKMLLKGAPPTEGMSSDEMYVDAYELCERAMFEQILSELVQAHQLTQLNTKNYVTTR